MGVDEVFFDHGIFYILSEDWAADKVAPSIEVKPGDIVFWNWHRQKRTVNCADGRSDSDKFFNWYVACFKRVGHNF